MNPDLSFFSKNPNWGNLNTFLHSFAVLLEDDMREEFYLRIQEKRINANEAGELMPTVLTEVFWMLAPAEMMVKKS